MGRACSMHGGEGIEGFGGKAKRKETTSRHVYEGG
jgi:hypothetical protein